MVIRRTPFEKMLIARGGKFAKLAERIYAVRTMEKPSGQEVTVVAPSETKTEIIVEPEKTVTPSELDISKLPAFKPKEIIPTIPEPTRYLPEGSMPIQQGTIPIEQIISEKRRPDVGFMAPSVLKERLEQMALEKEYYIGRSPEGKPVTIPITTAKYHHGYDPSIHDPEVARAYSKAEENISTNLEITMSNIEIGETAKENIPDIKDFIKQLETAPSGTTVTYTEVLPSGEEKLHENVSPEEALTFFKSHLKTLQDIARQLPVYKTEEQKIINQQSLISGYKKYGYTLKETDEGYTIDEPKSSKVYLWKHGAEISGPALTSAAFLASPLAIQTVGSAIQQIITGEEKVGEAELERLSRYALGLDVAIKKGQYVSEVIVSPAMVEGVYLPLATLGTSKIISAGLTTLSPYVSTGAGKTIETFAKISGKLPTGVQTAITVAKEPIKIVGKGTIKLMGTPLGKQTVKYGLYFGLEGRPLIETAIARPEEIGGISARSLFNWEITWKAMELGFKGTKLTGKEPILKKEWTILSEEKGKFRTIGKDLSRQIQDVKIIGEIKPETVGITGIKPKDIPVGIKVEPKVKVYKFEGWTGELLPEEKLLFPKKPAISTTKFTGYIITTDKPVIIEFGAKVDVIGKGVKTFKKTGIGIPSTEETIFFEQPITKIEIGKDTGYAFGKATTWMEKGLLTKKEKMIVQTFTGETKDLGWIDFTDEFKAWLKKERMLTEKGVTSKFYEARTVTKLKNGRVTVEGGGLAKTGMFEGQKYTSYEFTGEILERKPEKYVRRFIDQKGMILYPREDKLLKAIEFDIKSIKPTTATIIETKEGIAITGIQRISPKTTIKKTSDIILELKKPLIEAETGKGVSALLPRIAETETKIGLIVAGMPTPIVKSTTKVGMKTIGATLLPGISTTIISTGKELISKPKEIVVTETALVQEIKVDTKLKELTLLGEKLILEPVEKLKPIIETIPMTKEGIDVIEEEKEIYEPIVIQGIEKAQMQKQQQLQKLDLKTTSLLETDTGMISTIITTPITPVTIIPKIPWIKPSEEEKAKPLLVAKEKAKGEGFDVYVKERSMYHGKIVRPTKFKKRNIHALTKEEALGLGATIADETAAISFKIKPTEGKPKKSLLPSKSFKEIGYKFTKKGDIYIEKNKYRLDSPGEQKEISSLGRISRKQNLLSNKKLDLGIKKIVKKRRKKNVRYI